VNPTRYRTIAVNDLQVFYREAGAPKGPALLLLHGFPSSPRMWQPLIDRLADRYRMIAPDYPGFGHSDAPPASDFAYTFDRIAEVVEDFTDHIGLDRYTFVVQNYGGPVGMRLALRRPERALALIVQNAVCHQGGLGPLWETRRAFWADRARHEAALRENFLSPNASRQRHVGKSSESDRYDSDLWTDELPFLNRPGQPDIQTDLFYDYRTNVASYPAWQQWLRDTQPPLLVVWGTYDPSFEVAEAEAYRRDVPDADVHVIDAGHFAPNEAPDLVADLCRQFLDGLSSQ
jgi:pimeloyl-ACP methyl ester carboxylesterase